MTDIVHPTKPYRVVREGLPPSHFATDEDCSRGPIAVRFFTDPIAAQEYARECYQMPETRAVRLSVFNGTGYRPMLLSIDGGLA